MGFKVVITTMIFLMAGWVFVTIKTTRHLHRSCNIFVANLMIVNVVLAFLSTTISGIMTIGHAAGVGDFLSVSI